MESAPVARRGLDYTSPRRGQTMNAQTIAAAGAGRRFAPLLRAVRARPWLVLVPALILFVAVPLVVPYSDNLYDDEGAYVGLGKLLASGHLLTGRDTMVGGGNAPPNLWFGPGLPAVLAALVKLHASLDVLRLVGPVALFAALVSFYALLRLFVPVRAALLGAAAFVAYLPFYTVIAFIHAEPLAVLFVTLLLYATVRYEREGRGRWLTLGACSFAALAITRVAYGWVMTAVLVAAAIAYLVRRDERRRRLLLVPALALVLCVPWLGYTYSVTHHALYWGSSGAMSLYWMSSPADQDVGDWHGANDVFSDPNLAAHRPYFRSLIGLDLNAQNHSLEHHALDNVSNHPFKFAQNVADNISRMWLNTPYSFKSARLTSVGYALPNLLLLFGLVAAAVRTVRRRTGRPGLTAGWMGVFAVVAFGLHSVFSAYPRMLIPIVPIALLAIVTGLRPIARVERD
jgi:4-amino-4-deoxy-L-arabinose transferase-like glycosyltransferase